MCLCGGGGGISMGGVDMSSFGGVIIKSEVETALSSLSPLSLPGLVDDEGQAVLSGTTVSGC